jgi:polyisoprenoid-binding protein YceI
VRGVRKLYVAASAVALATAAGPAGAAARCFSVDAAQSQVDFRIRVFGFFSPGGRFQRIAGTVVFDPQHWETLKVVIRIAVEGLESRPRFWRDELLGPRFFDRVRYPSITYEGTHAEQTGPESGVMLGSLTLRGTTRPVPLRTRLAPAPDVLEIAAEASVRRSDFGFGGVLPLASDEVAITMHLRAAPVDCGN